MNFVESRNQEISITHGNVTLFVKREDLIHPYISGNKFRKLKYNLVQAKKENKDTLLTFGGAFSNHILAVAAAGKEHGFKTIGIIRGEELRDKIADNPTLQKAQEFGMVFDFIDRERYREKHTPDFIAQLSEKYRDFYLIPEGGTNALAVKGCEEILTAADEQFDYICCAVGTGGTISGLINCSKNSQQVLGFPALKGDFLREDICKFAVKSNWDLITDYHFGGYAKVTEELILFMNAFYQTQDIPLDPIYTGKMMFGVMDMIAKNYFPENAKILVIHSGGLQGIAGINKVLKQKKQVEITMRKTILVLLMIFMVSCNANHAVVRTTKSDPRKAETPIVQRVRKPIYRPVTAKNPVAITKKDTPTVGNYTNSTEVLEATTRVKVTTAMVLAYIENYKNVAKDNMIRTGIPASITLGQALLESGAGTGPLSVQANNHFGIKCHKEWTGPSIRYTDDAENECFRKYDDPSRSFRDHSFFLTSRPRYAELFEFGRDDYKSWAYGLKAAGYATDSKYPDKLIGLIEKYQLNRFDAEVLGKEFVPVASNKPITYSENSQKYTVVKGDSLYSISKKFNISIDELKKKNNLGDNTISLGQSIIVK